MTENLALPLVNTQEVISNPDVQKIIDEQMKTSTARWQELKDFLENWLQKLFADQNKTSEQVDEIFKQVVEIDEIKQSTKDIINTYQSVDNEAVGKALKQIDNDLTEIKPLVAKLKDSIEWTAWFFKRLFSWSNKKIFLSSLQWLAWRIDSIDWVFENCDVNLKKNEQVLWSLVPEIGFRISKIDGMIKALEIILWITTDENAKKIISNLRDELLNMSGIQKESLSRLMLLSVMNWNSKLVLQASRVEVLMSLQPLIAENIIWANQKKVYEMRDKVREWINSLREGSKQNITDIMNLEESEKAKLKTRLDEVTANIDWVVEKSKQHQQNMEKAQKLINDYLPEYKSKVEKLENRIYEIGQQSSSFNDASQILINQMIQEKKAIEQKVKVDGQEVSV